MTFIEAFAGAAKSILSRFTPVSGKKRSRNETEANEPPRRADLGRASQHESPNVDLTMEPAQEEPAPSGDGAAEIPVSHVSMAPAPVDSSNAGFSLADRVKVDWPGQGNSMAQHAGTSQTTYSSLQQQQRRPSQGGIGLVADPFTSAAVGQRRGLPAPRPQALGGRATALVAPAQPSARPPRPSGHTPAPAWPLVPGLTPPAGNASSTPCSAVGRSSGMHTPGGQPAQPRQLSFGTPSESARKGLHSLNLGGAGGGGTTSMHRQQVAQQPVLVQPPPQLWSRSPGGASGSAAGAAGYAAPAARDVGTAAGAGHLMHHGPMGPVPPQGLVVTTGQSFRHVFVQFGDEVAVRSQQGGGSLSLGEYQLLLQRFKDDREAWHRSSAPVREDGGYVPGDAEEDVDRRVTEVSAQARMLAAQVRHATANAARTATAGSSPQVTAAASRAAEAKTRLEVTLAKGGAEGLTAVSHKVEAHERSVAKIRKEGQAAATQAVESMKATDAKRLAEARQRLANITAASAAAHAPAAQARLPAASAVGAAPGRPQPQPHPHPHGRPPAAAAAGRPGAASGSRAKPVAKAADDEVMDLVSSDEEEEEDGEDAGGEVDEAEEDEGESEGEQEEYEEDEEEYGGSNAGGKPRLRRISTAEQNTWERTMDRSLPPNEVLLAFAPNPATDIKLPREKLQCLATATWLNDEVINLYMLLLQDRDTRLRNGNVGGPAAGSAAASASGGGGGGGGRGRGGRASPSSAAAVAAPKCHFFNSFFYNKLFQDDHKYNYSNVRRWTLPARLRNTLQASADVGLLDLDRVIMPIHQGVHWTCAVVDLREKVVRYFDSLKGEDRALTQHLLQWVGDESEDKLKKRWDTSKWRVEFPKNIPTQRNGCDCGVFAIMFADRLGAGLPFDFDQPDMELLRVRVLSRIIRMRVDLD